MGLMKTFINGSGGSAAISDSVANNFICSSDATRGILFNIISLREDNSEIVWTAHLE